MNDCLSMLNVDRRLRIVMIMPILAMAYRLRYSMANYSALIVKNLGLLVHNLRLVVFGVRRHRVALGVAVPCLEMPHIRPFGIMITQDVAVVGEVGLGLQHFMRNCCYWVMRIV